MSAETRLYGEYSEEDPPTDEFLESLGEQMDGSTVLLNTQYPSLTAGTSTYASWFAYQSLSEEAEEAGEEETEAPDFDLVRANAAEALTEGLWITNLSNTETFWLTFEGTADDLTMRYGVTEWETDERCPVTFERSGEQFLIRDGQAIGRAIPGFDPNGYLLVFEYQSMSLHLDLDMGTRLDFEDIH